MTKKLFCEAIIKYILGILLIGMLIFIPAGTLNYFGGRLLMIILFLPMLLAGVIMMIKDPNLLKSRLKAKEKDKKQRAFIAFGGIMFFVGFVIAGLNFRFKWHILPWGASIVGAVIFLIGYMIYAEVLRENKFLSRTVEIQKNQKVISNGLYGIVRHPMYSSTLLLFISMPIILGSLLSLLVFLVYPFIIVKRINNEEKFLEKELDGYKEYKKKVKYKLIPYIF